MVVCIIKIRNYHRICNVKKLQVWTLVRLTSKLVSQRLPQLRNYRMQEISVVLPANFIVSMT